MESPLAAYCCSKGVLYLDYYDVYLNQEIVGGVNVTEEGLYYRISCRCTLDEGIYRLIAYFENTSVQIGVCVPQGSDYILEKKIPIKQLNKEIKAFQIISKDTVSGQLIPISDDKPFEGIQELEHARFEEYNDCLCIRIMSQSGC